MEYELQISALFSALPLAPRDGKLYPQCGAFRNFLIHSDL